MIIKSKARRLGGLTVHLTDTKKNERVSQRHDLDRDANRDLGTALLDFAANAKLSNPSPRARQLFHIKVSPSHILTESELIRTIEIIEAEHNIPKSTPRKVIEHLKGNRAEHYHLIYSHYDPISCKAICTKRNYVNDEMASRFCELEFNETIVVGKHTEDNALELEARNFPENAAKLRHAMSTRKQSSNDRSIIRYNDPDTSKKSISFENHIWELFVESGQNIRSFKTTAINAGLSFAMGEKAIVIMNPETRINIPLLRLLNKRAKSKGLSNNLRKADLEELTKDEPLLPVKTVREQFTTRRINHIKRRAAIERQLFLRFAPKVSVEQPVDPEMGKKGKPTLQTIQSAIEFNRHLQEMLRQKLLAILLKKKIIRRLTKRLEHKSPRGMALFLTTEMRVKMNANQIAFMASSQAVPKPILTDDGNKIATMKVAHDRNTHEVIQNSTVNAIQNKPLKMAASNKSPKLKKHKRAKPDIER